MSEAKFRKRPTGSNDEILYSPCEDKSRIRNLGGRNFICRGSKTSDRAIGHVLGLDRAILILQHRDM